ncbi:Hypothetical predicted protein [Olea europaea subsp. europaea]|uniref:Uncharacterized protein n=1 Tax=Olea europaea subsp. europaea TaxID=158383 RepID=A0A8S0PAT2_OLEEU|nr:Hypothetical predicted protein [Olea europaea subsp. europaea]
MKLVPLVLAGAPPVLPIFDAMAPSPSLGLAPALGLGGHHHHFNGESQSKMANGYPPKQKSHINELIKVASSADAPSFPPGKDLGKLAALQLVGGYDNELVVPEMANAVVAPSSTVS